MLTVRSNPVSRAPVRRRLRPVRNNRHEYRLRQRHRWTQARNVNDERGYAGARREPAARAARRPTPRNAITTRKAGAGSVSRRSARSDESTHHLLAIAEFDDNASAAPQQPHALGLSPLHTNQQPICSVTTSMTSPFCITDLTPLRSIKQSLGVSSYM